MPTGSGLLDSFAADGTKDDPVTPGKYTLKIYKGATFDITMTWKTGDPPAPVDLTGCSARLQIRASVDSTVAAADLSTSNGKIILGGTAGTIRLVLSAAETSALGLEAGVYDLEIISAGGLVTRLLQGRVKTYAEVTR